MVRKQFLSSDESADCLAILTTLFMQASHMQVDSLPETMSHWQVSASTNFNGQTHRQMIWKKSVTSHLKTGISPVLAAMETCKRLLLASINKQDWIINLGTGSQIISFVEPAEDAFELRQYFQNVTVHCVTHIPAGRALNVWARFFQLVRDETNPDYFWRMLRSAGPQISPAKMPAFDLAVFHEAFGYDGGGKISNIHEDHFGPPQLFAGLLNSFLTQHSIFFQMLIRIWNDPFLLREYGHQDAVIKDRFEAYGTHYHNPEGTRPNYGLHG